MSTGINSVEVTKVDFVNNRKSISTIYYTSVEFPDAAFVRYWLRVFVLPEVKTEGYQGVLLINFGLEDMTREIGAMAQALFESVEHTEAVLKHEHCPPGVLTVFKVSGRRYEGAGKMTYREWILEVSPGSYIAKKG